MEKIIHNGTLVAVLIRKFENGITPLSDSDQPLQVLIHKREKGSYTKAHLHRPKERMTKTLQECLVVLKGRIKIDFYTIEKNIFKSIEASGGEVIIFISGGHAVHILENSEIVEVKNGPFVEDRDFIE